MVVNSFQYNSQKQAFIKKHNFDFTVQTSTIDHYGVYCKTYNFADGACWMERMSPKYETVKLSGTSRYTENPITQEVEVKFLETEFWSTEQGSQYYYERF